MNSREKRFTAVHDFKSRQNANPRRRYGDGEQKKQPAAPESIRKDRTKNQKGQKSLQADVDRKQFLDADQRPFENSQYWKNRELSFLLDAWVAVNLRVIRIPEDRARGSLPRSASSLLCRRCEPSTRERAQR